jgi:hypothetical protein
VRGAVAGSRAIGEKANGSACVTRSTDLGIWQPLHGVAAHQLALVQAVEAATAAEPQCPARPLRDGESIAGFGAADFPETELAVLATHHARRARESDPHPIGRVHEYAADRRAGHRRLVFERVKLPVLERLHPASFRAEPQRAAAILGDGGHNDAAQSDVFEYAVALPHDAALRGDPERAVGGLVEPANRLVLGEGRRVRALESHETHAVETPEPGFGSDPQITIARLARGGDVCLRQTKLGAERVEDILSGQSRARGIRGRRARRGETQSGEQSQDEAPATRAGAMSETKSGGGVGQDRAATRREESDPGQIAVLP